MRIDVVTIFPELFEPFVRTSLLGAAREAGRIALEVHDLRRFTRDRHRSVDDVPYGGGPGMILKPEPLVEAIEALAGAKGSRRARVILLSPQGEPFHQDVARSLAAEAHLVLVCGRYEGVDQRAIELAVDLELTIGDYVLSGGEIPALVVLEAITRLVPGVIGREESHQRDSFGHDGLLDHPHYTRPQEFRGMAVPEILLSGDHAEIDRWRREAALEKTRRNRPDLLER